MTTLRNRTDPNRRHPGTPQRAGVASGRSVRLGAACALVLPLLAVPTAFTLLPDRAVACPQVAPDRAPGTGAANASLDARYQGILRMLGAGSFETAAASSRVILEQSPAEGRAAALLGIALCKMKKYEEAKPYLVQARDSAQSFPERMHATHFLGWCTYHLGELAESKAAFERHLKDVPGEPDSTFGLAVVALSEDRLDDAERLFKQALEGFSKPAARPADQARVLVRMSDLALRRDNPVEAEALLDRAAQASPLQPETWAKLARVRDRLGQHEKADAARANERRILEARGARESGNPAPPQSPNPSAPASGTPGSSAPVAPAREKPTP